MKNISPKLSVSERETLTLTAGSPTRSRGLSISGRFLLMGNGTTWPVQFLDEDMQVTRDPRAAVYISYTTCNGTPAVMAVEVFDSYEDGIIDQEVHH